MSNLIPIDNQQIKEQLEELARQTGKPLEIVASEVIEMGLKSYTTTPTKSLNTGPSQASLLSVTT
ncbi:MAG TPA: hypothetical protein DHW02_00855 [Ktedonobacter sp.]|jgi:hypothetical protein|nr:hypothetical protein [Ktedonobacter sp.]